MSPQPAHQDISVERPDPPVSREEFLDYMTFRDNRRPLFDITFGPLVGLKREWAAQGATPDELSFAAFRTRTYAAGRVPVNTGWHGEHRREILEETSEYRLERDHLGRVMKLIFRSATIPLPLNYPVETAEDWLRLKPHYQFSEERFRPGWAAQAREHLAAGRVLTVGIPGGFDEPRQLLGEERACLAYYEEPELIHDMLDTFAETALRVFERVTAEVPVDMLTVHEDMAGKSGPLAGPRQIREFIGPYYARIWDLLRDRGARLFAQDSDGDIRPVLPDFLQAGLNETHPCEPAAGMDIVELREQFGTDLAIKGGLDKHVLRRSRDDIEAELEYKIPPLVATGGCVLGLDHRIPNGTPLENYRFYIAKAWEIMEREARKL
jgi:hypothetical protein